MTDPQLLAQTIHEVLVEFPSDPAVLKLRAMLGRPLSRKYAAKGRELYVTKVHEYNKAGEEIKDEANPR